MPQWQAAAEARRANRSEPERQGLRDVDAVKRTRTLRIAAWSGVGGVVGGLLGVFGAAQGVWGIGTALVIAVLGSLVMFSIPSAAAWLGGGAAKVMLAPSGRSTPRKREYSLAESLTARGLHADAIAAFQTAIAQDPSDPTPYLRIARIHRDRTQQLPEAAIWFKRSLAESTMPVGTARLTRRELVELYVTRMGEPSRAAPLLARTAEEHAGTPEGEWAAAELTRVKAMIVGESTTE